jgi:hypothetical protein
MYKSKSDNKYNYMDFGVLQQDGAPPFYHKEIVIKLGEQAGLLDGLLFCLNQFAAISIYGRLIQTRLRFPQWSMLTVETSKYTLCENGTNLLTFKRNLLASSSVFICIRYQDCSTSSF